MSTPEVGNLENKISDGDPRLFVSFRVHGFPILSLIDTGAARSLMSKEIWEKIKLRQCRVDELTPADLLVTVTGDEIKTLGKTKIAILGKIVSFYVTEDSSHDILLGADALKTLNANIKINNDTITLNNQVLKYIKSQKGDEISFTGVQTELDKLKKEFPNVFIKPGEKLTHAEGEEMVIEIENNHPPINQRAYRIPLNKMKIVEDELKFMLENDIIEPSTSAWASPICLARKKDGKWRFCVDYRKFNDVTVKEAQVPSRIDGILNHFGGAQYFSTIDLYKAYCKF